jgi:hypothetical protein
LVSQYNYYCFVILFTTHIANIFDFFLVHFFLLLKDDRETIFKERIKSANDKRVRHDANMNSMRYRELRMKMQDFFMHSRLGQNMLLNLCVRMHLETFWESLGSHGKD